MYLQYFTRIIQGFARGLRAPNLRMSSHTESVLCVERESHAMVPSPACNGKLQAGGRRCQARKPRDSNTKKKSERQGHEHSSYCERIMVPPRAACNARSPEIELRTNGQNSQHKSEEDEEQTRKLPTPNAQRLEFSEKKRTPPFCWVVMNFDFKIQI